MESKACGSLERKAYENGLRMGKYIVRRDGIEGARVRGSKSNIRYVRKALVDAYDRGYMEAIERCSLSSGK